MSQSLTNILIHIIFSTKDRQPLINQCIEGQLHAYMAAVFKESDSPAIIIGGIETHVHILCSLSKKNSLSKVLEDVKKVHPNGLKQLVLIMENFIGKMAMGHFRLVFQVR